MAHDKPLKTENRHEIKNHLAGIMALVAIFELKRTTKETVEVAHKLNVDVTERVNEIVKLLDD